MLKIGMIHLLRIDLPGRVIRLCDGGFINFSGEIYKSKDDVFGVIGSASGITEGIGEEVPALEITLLPPMTSAPAELSAPGYQNSIVRLWSAEYNEQTGLIVGAASLDFHGQIDQMTFTAGRNRREVTLSIVSTAERLFNINDGNSLTPRWHKSIWPGEKGHDNATGLTIPIAWGAEGRPVAGSGEMLTGSRNFRQ